MHCIVIRHVAFEDLGVFCDVFSEEGITYEYWDCERPRDEATFLGADLAIVLGGPIGVGDEDRYPLVQEETALVKKRLEAGLPLLGICLGAQYMAHARGARVYPGPKKEIGWGTVSLCHKGGLLAPLESAPVLHWHGDTFDLPESATLLASSEITPNQAFSLAKGQLALQFHVEADASKMESWLVGHCCELAYAGIDPCALREDAQRLGGRAARAGREVCRLWLQESRKALASLGKQ